MMRIGITTNLADGFSVWSNGLIQNIFFLAQSLNAVPFVSQVDLIDTSGQAADLGETLRTAGLDKVGQIGLAQAADCTDVIIEMGGSCPAGWMNLQRARGKKAVFYNVMQPYSWFNEIIFDKEPPLFDAERWDEIWLLDKDRDLVPVMHTWYRCPVRTVPMLWDSCFVRQRVAELEQHGLRFGWQHRGNKGRQPLKAAILEPNLHVLKVGVIPLLGCDAAYRDNPKALDMVYMLNAKHMAEHPTLLYLANALDVVKQNKAVFIERHDTPYVLSDWANLVVSHQWNNEQNIMYCDVLFGDYPLVHNSPWLKRFGAGYYYPDFDCNEAGKQIQTAYSQHHRRLAEQQAAKDAVLKAVAPLSPDNIRLYAERLTLLCADSPQLLKM